MMNKSATPISRIVGASSSTADTFRHQRLHDQQQQQLVRLDPYAHSVSPEHHAWTREFQSHNHHGQQVQKIQSQTQAMEAAWSMQQQMRQQMPSKQWTQEFQSHPHSAVDMKNVEIQLSQQFDQLFQQQHATRQDTDMWERQFKHAMEADAVETPSSAQEMQQMNELFDEFQTTWHKSSNDNNNAASDPQQFDQWEDQWNQAAAPSRFSPFSKQMDLKEYLFEDLNPFTSHADPYQAGLDLMQTSGSLSQAALAFEAEVQRNPTNAQAWSHLGKMQAENEKEDPAIAALQRAVHLNPQQFDALMALAVSYTNETYDHQAFKALASWVVGTHPEQVAAIHSAKGDIDGMPVFELYDHVTEMFLAVAREGVRANAPIDPDIQVGLGILFYNSGQYEKSVDCFNTALQVRPDDYLLWNRLGATLANSGRSEEAVDAYYRALDIRPNFVRGRYNLGVSCLNIGCYKEAAEHFLGALSLHDGDTALTVKNISENLWDTLRRAFHLMDRGDLANQAITGADLAMFRREFTF